MSDDKTATICRDFGCRVFLQEFLGYGPQKQFAVSRASNDWIMYLDADEVLTEELQQEIRSLFPAGAAEEKEEPRFDTTRVAGFQVQSSLSYMGRILRYSGVGKEFHLRLFNRTRGGFSNLPVHESIEVDGETQSLKGRVIHYSYRSISHHIEKINTYTSLAANGNHNRGKTFPKIWVAIKFPASFFSFYILKKGFLDGYPGFIWSLFAAVYATMKVAKTIEKESRP